MAGSAPGFSAQVVLGFGPYRTAWFMAHRIREGMREARIIGSLGGDGRFAAHETVMHSADEYVRGDVHTNSVEGYFAILKRGIYGTYHHVSHAVGGKRHGCELVSRLAFTSAPLRAAGFGFRR
jgi:hypothetical protein